MGYNPLINGLVISPTYKWLVYWGYSPLINGLVISPTYKWLVYWGGISVISPADPNL